MLYQQPQGGPLQIDWSNPITKGLRFAFLNTSAAPLGWSAGTMPPSRGSSSLVAAPGGVGYKATSASTQMYDTGPVGIVGPNYTLFALATASGAGTQSVIDDDSGTSPSRCFQFRLNARATEMITFDSSNNSFFATAAAMTDAQMAAGFTMAAQVAGNAIAVFQNGVKTSPTASGTRRVPTGNFRIGQSKGSGNTGWVAGALLVELGWDRTLSDAEMQSIHANPHQVFLDPDEDDEALMFATIASAAYSLAAAVGTFGLTGNAVLLRASRHLAAAAASYATTGNAVTVRAARSLSAAPAGIALTGGAVALRIARSMAVLPGSFALSGAGVGLLASRRLPVAAGAFVVTGQAVGLVYMPTVPVRAVVAQAATFAVVGNAAAIRSTRRMAAAPGAIVISGSAPALALMRRLSATCGGFVFTSSAVTFTVGLIFHYARAPAGSGYAPQCIEVQRRPADGNTVRPADTQWNHR